VHVQRVRGASPQDATGSGRHADAYGARRSGRCFAVERLPDADRLVAELRPHVEDGDLVLFTGAGFTGGARSVIGDPIPTSQDLRALLWPIAFPGEAPDESTLEDVYECAVAADEAATGDLLRSRLMVEPTTLAGSYRTWLSVPWARLYTLNVDDLDDAASRHWELPSPVRSVSALTDGLPARTDGLLSIHLNGRVADYPAMTFSQLQYGQRTATPDPWYQHLAADLRDRPVVFVGTSLDEPPLWQQVAIHLLDRDPDDIPRSYLVATRVPRARREVLRRLRVEWVPADAATFAEEVLGRLV
jgi:hypothetical protein